MTNNPKKKYLTKQEKARFLDILRELVPQAKSWPALTEDLARLGFKFSEDYIYGLCNQNGIPRPAGLARPRYKGNRGSQYMPRHAADTVRALIPQAGSIKELHALVQKTLGVELSIGTFKSYLANHKIRTGYRVGRPQGDETSAQLCWTCANAVPSADGKRGCAWSRSRGRVPVDGVKKSRAGFILKCPEFVEG